MLQNDTGGDFQDSPAWVTIPPVEFRANIISLYHNRLGHSGIENTRIFLAPHFRWPGFKTDIKAVVLSCDACQRRKYRPLGSTEPQRFPITRALDTVHVDLTGPFIVDENHATSLFKIHGKTTCYAMIMIDSFTKLLEVELIIRKDALTAAQVFHNTWVCRYGLPSTIISDRGSEFMGEFHDYAEKQGVYISRTRPYHPQANGKGEAAVKAAKKMLTIATDDFPAIYPELLPDVKLAYMARFHSAVGSTPFQLLTGRAIRLFNVLPESKGPFCQANQYLSKALQRTHSDPDFPKLRLTDWEKMFFEDLGQRMAKLDAKASKRLNLAADKHLRQAQSRYFKEHPMPEGRPFRVGDKVLTQLESQPGLTTFQETKLGPYTIVSIDGDMLTIKGSGKKTVDKAKDRCSLYWNLHSAVREFGSAGDKQTPPAPNG
jgi:transposase InsO family protein